MEKPYNNYELSYPKGEQDAPAKLQGHVDRCIAGCVVRLAAITALASGMITPLHGAIEADIETEISQDSPEEQIRKLQTGGRYDLALRRAREIFTYNCTENNCRLVLRCAREYQKEAMKNITLAEKPTSFKGELSNFWVRIGKDPNTWGALTSVVSGGSSVLVWKVLTKDTETKENAKKEAEGLAIQLPSSDKVKSIIESLESQKVAIVSLIDQLDASMVQEFSPWKQKLYKEAVAFKKELKKVRTRYLSYNVMSPHLFEAHRKGFIASLEGDKRGYDEALKVVARGMNAQFLYQAAEDVIEQYFDVILFIKNKMDGEQWNEAKQRMNLVESLDKSKPRGSDAWCP